MHTVAASSDRVAISLRENATARDCVHEDISAGHFDGDEGQDGALCRAVSRIEGAITIDTGDRNIDDLAGLLMLHDRSARGYNRNSVNIDCPIFVPLIIRKSLVTPSDSLTTGVVIV